MSDVTSAHRMVVGVDTPDSSASRGLWACAEAGRRHAELDVVHAWMPPMAEVTPIGLPGRCSTRRRSRHRAKRVLDEAIDRVPSEVRRTVPAIHPIAPQERSSQALLHVSASAELLVVGTRRHGALRGLLGSVSHQCAHHARCPVVVIPPDWPSARVPNRIVVGVDAASAPCGRCGGRSTRPNAGAARCSSPGRGSRHIRSSRGAWS